MPGEQVTNYVNAGDADLTNAVSEGVAGFANTAEFVAWSWAELNGRT